MKDNKKKSVSTKFSIKTLFYSLLIGGIIYAISYYYYILGKADAKKTAISIVDKYSYPILFVLIKNTSRIC